MSRLVVDGLANKKRLRVVNHTHRGINTRVVPNANAVSTAAHFLVAGNAFTAHHANARGVLDVGKVPSEQVPVDHRLAPSIRRGRRLLDGDLASKFADVHNEYSV